MFVNYVYILTPEDKPYSKNIQLYFDKKYAMKALVRSILKSRSSFVVNVFTSDKVKEAPLRLHKSIRMKQSSNGHHLLWLKRSFLDYSTEQAIDEPEVFFDTFEEIDEE